MPTIRHCSECVAELHVRFHCCCSFAQHGTQWFDGLTVRWTGDLWWLKIRGWIVCILQISPTGNAQLDFADVHAGTKKNVHQLVLQKCFRLAFLAKEDAYDLPEADLILAWTWWPEYSFLQTFGSWSQTYRFFLRSSIEVMPEAWKVIIWYNIE